MKIGDVLKKVGGSILKNAFPPFSGMAFDAINAFLPDDKKLDAMATGTEAAGVISSLPPDLQSSLMEKELEVEITEIKEWTNVLTALSDADKSGATTRPYIAREMSRVLAFGTIVPLSVLSVAIWTGDADTIKEVGNAWPLFLAILGTPAALLRAYFGMRTREKEKRYELAGAPQKTGWIQDIITSFKAQK